jgi:hypothetical protein
MKRMVGLMAVVAALALFATAALAFMGPGNMGMGPGMMGMGHGMMYGATGCPGMMAGTPAAAIGEDKVKALVEEYATSHLPGYTVEKVLPFTGRHGTAYSVELKGPNAEMRVLHVNPFGEVMPFGGPWRRGG